MNEFKKKIIEKCGNLTKFCVRANLSQSGLYRILTGERKGGAEFWFKAKHILNVSDEDILQYMKEIRGERNARKQSNNDKTVTDNRTDTRGDKQID